MSNKTPKWEDTTEIDDVPKWDDTTEMEEVGKLESFGRGAAQGLSFGFADEITGGLEALLSDKTYKQARDESRANYDEAEEANPGTYLAGEIGGSIAVPIPGMAAAKGASLAARAGKTALSAGAQGALAGAGMSEEESLAGIFQDAGKGAAVGGALGGAIPVAGAALKKGASAGKKLIPGTEGAYDIVNKGVAEVSGLNPFSKATAEEIKDLYSDVAGRRAARGANISDDVMKVTDDLNKATGKLKERGSKAYSDLEDQAMDTEFTVKDADTVSNFLDEDLQDTILKLKEYPEMYSTDARKSAERVLSVMTKGAPNEIEKKGAFWAGKNIDQLEGKHQNQALRWRLLEARREIDDVTKNKNWERMNRNDRELILNLRNNINTKIQFELSGSDKLKAADDLWSGMSQSLNDSFGSAMVNGQIDPTRLKNNLNTGLVRGKAFAQNKEKLQQFIVQAEGELGKIPEMEDAMKALSELQALAEKKMKLDVAERSAGGPTGQGTNNVIQLMGAVSTGGWSLLALPITNPAAYTQLIDGLASAVGKAEATRFAQVVQRGIKAAMDKAPGAVARLYSLRGQD